MVDETGDRRNWPQSWSATDRRALWLYRSKVYIVQWSTFESQKRSRGYITVEIPTRVVRLYFPGLDNAIWYFPKSSAASRLR